MKKLILAVSLFLLISIPALYVYGFQAEQLTANARHKTSDIYSKIQSRYGALPYKRSVHPLSGKAPNIVLLSVDTLRADHFSPEHMPMTYQWAEDNCQIFENAHSAATWTLPSHVSLLTGLLPHEHGVDHNRIPSNTPLLQSRLRVLGYRTYGFTNSGLVSQKHGFDEGFDYWYERLEPPDRDFDKALLSPLSESESLLQTAPNPFFAFVHTYFVHEYKGEVSIVPPNADFYSWRTQHASEVVEKYKGQPDKFKELYANKVHAFDSHLHDYLANLTSQHKNLIVIVTSDHGEQLFDGSKGLGHRMPPYYSQTHVPLFIYGVKPKTSTATVSTNDINGMIMAFVQGESFTPAFGMTAEFVKSPDIFIAAAGLGFRTWKQRPFINAAKPASISKEQSNQLKALGYLH